jgi:hypothetical protein
VALDLNDHLLQAVDGLLATLLGELLLHVVVGTVSGIASTLLGLLRNVLTGLLLETVSTLLKALGGIDTRVGVLLLIAASEVSDIGRVTRATGVSGLGGVTESTLGLISVKGLLLVVLRLGLVLEVVLGKVRNIVPSVVLSGLVDLVELILGRVDLVGRLLSSITGHISEENASIAH